MTRVQLLLLAVLVLAPLFNFLMRAIKRRLDAQAARDVGREVPRVPVPARSLAAPPIEAGHRPRDTPRRLATRMVVTSAGAGGRAPVLLERHRDMRRGIVLMTLLGPCRALEPPGA
jgi:hypothetical protein